MDSIGVPELQWVKGFNGCKARYIDRATVVFSCGNNINFMKEGGKSDVFTSPGEGVVGLDVHPLNKLFAFAELCLNPRIFVYKYPDMEEVSVLADGAQLEYRTLAFSSSDYLVSISGIPDFKFTLWNHVKGEALISLEVSHDPIRSISVNPGNWRQICLTTNECLTVITVEQSDVKFNAFSKNTKMFIDSEPKEAQTEKVTPTTESLAIHKLEYQLTPSAIAGLLAPEAERFEDHKYSGMKCQPLSHAWTPAGDIYIGCEDGQLLKLDGETWKLKPIYIPTMPKRYTRGESLVRGASLLSKDMSILEEDSTLSMETVVGPGALDCMALHNKGLYVGGKDGVLRCLKITNDNLKLEDSYQVGCPITSLDFSTNWSHLNIGSSNGVMYTYDINSPGSTTTFMAEHCGNFIGVQSLSPGLDHVVTVREKGELQVWTIEDGSQVGMMHLGVDVTAMVCSPVAPVAVIGTASGFVFAVDLTDPTQGRIIHRTRPYSKPVTRITYSETGAVILLGCDEGHVVMMSGLADKGFKMLCYTSVDGAVESITTFTDSSNDIYAVVSSNPTGDIRHGATKCTTFMLTEKMLTSIETYYSSLKADIQEEAVNKIVFNYASPSYGACLVSPDVLYSLAQDNKMLQKLNVPKEKPKKPNSKDSYLMPEAEFPSHQLPGGKILLSPHKKWLASVGADGKLQVRTIGSAERFVEAHPHDYRHGGVKTLCWSAGSQHVLTTGRTDGILTCYSFRYTPSGEAKAKSAVASAKQTQSQHADLMMRERDALKKMGEWTPDPSKTQMDSSHHGSPNNQKESTLSNIEKAVHNDEIYQTPTPVPKADTTWLEARELLAHSEEDKQYAETKKDLRFEIREIRRTLQGLMEKNKSVPDIEKLQHHDFDLDVDEQQRLQSVGDAEVQKIKEAMEFENLAKQYLTHLMKQECWDGMDVKGRAIEGFGISMEVQNYPLKQRNKQEAEELARASAIRRIEMAEAKARAELVEIPVPNPSKAAGGTEEDGDEDDNQEGDAPSITGSMGALYGGKSDLFYNQFELYNREQKIIQIILLKDAIHRIKHTFNKEFSEVMVKKEQEISKMNEKNKRIAKIFEDLSISDQVTMYRLSTKEKPELLLTVDDEEVTVEKYLTPEQQKAKEEFEKAEEERRKREKGDNARERALDQMMGGVLEIKKEDELKKDVPLPTFIQVGKEPEDWTEDEQKVYKEYEKKVKELNEEREKYRKQLEAELKKLQQAIVESEQGFNDQLKALFTKKLKIEMVICQEELKIVRLQWSIMFEKALETKEKQIEAAIEHKKQLKQLAAEAYIIARKNVDNFREGYDILVAEDKVMDKGFKREFADLPALQYEQLYKLFRKRPRGTKAFHTRGETPILDANSGNPFAERPSTARQNMLQKHALDSALQELDKHVNIPEGVDDHAWGRLCKYRRNKIESEMLVKQKALIMAELMSFQQKRQDEDYKLAEEIDDLGQELSRLKDAMNQHKLNLQVQLLMKQGQVEVDAGSFIHDYSDSVLIHRGVVEDLNGKIKALGESKIASMVESKDFRKGIIQLEWEHKKNMMKIEDLKEKMRVINMMKVTREIQSYLNQADHDGKIAQEVSVLEQTIELQKKHHEANVSVKKKMVKELKNTIRDREFENKILVQEIEELNVSVNERNHIHEASADKNAESSREKRYQEIVQRRKLVDLAKAQANEVAVLRAEVERLRMRTFPALVQVER